MGSNAKVRTRNNQLDVHLNLNVRGMLASATVSLNERCESLRAQGREIFKLGLGQSPFPVPAPVVEALKAHAHEKSYLPVKGLHELRVAVAEYHRRKYAVQRSAEDVLIGPGSKELMFLLQLVYYGDLVIPTPTWVSYAPQADMLGRKVRWLVTRSEDGWRLTPDQLESLCAPDPGRPRIVVLNYPSNPTGGTYRLDELKEIARVARKNRVVLLSDEIYGELHFKGQHVSLARFYPEGTIVSAGLSKWCGAGGWRLGTFLFPPSLRWLLDAMAAAASETYTATSAPIQYAAVRAFVGGMQVERYLKHSRRVLRALGRVITEELTSANVLVARPQGGFYVFIDATPFAQPLESRAITTSAEMCERLLEETGVAIIPGSAFGRPPQELTARIAFVDFDGAGALAAAESIPVGTGLHKGDFLSTHCGGVLEAVRRIGSWLAT